MLDALYAMEIETEDITTLCECGSVACIFDQCLMCAATDAANAWYNADIAESKRLFAEIGNFVDSSFSIAVGNADGVIIP